MPMSMIVMMSRVKCTASSLAGSHYLFIQNFKLYLYNYFLSVSKTTKADIDAKKKFGKSMTLLNDVSGWSHKMSSSKFKIYKYIYIFFYYFGSSVQLTSDYLKQPNKDCLSLIKPDFKIEL